MSNFLFRVWNPIGTVTKHVNSWRPGTHGNEREYSAALAAHLREWLPEGITVVEEYGIGNGIADICVDDRVAVEVKNDLIRPSTLDRLLGQVTRYRGAGKLVIVVLVGRVRPDLRVELADWIQRNNDSFLHETVIELVDKVNLRV